MSQTLLNLPLIQSYRPRSFRDRGVAPPFTTRFLLGARLRQPPDAVSGLEVVVPNPSGGKGVYILPWLSVGVLGRPTMHDVVLGRSVAALLLQRGGVLTPRVLDEAVGQVALQGLAGPLVAQAAADAAQNGRDAAFETRFRLLADITQQVEGRRADLVPLAQDTRENIEQRGRAALTAFAARIDQPPERLMDAIENLAGLFGDIGIAEAACCARLPRLLQSIREMQRDLVAWLQAESGTTGRSPAEETREAAAIARSAELVTRVADFLLIQARDALKDPSAAMRQMVENEQELSSRIARAFWLLDGWEGIVRIWMASPSLLPRNAALADIARSLPPLPDEAETWLGLPAGTAEQLDRLPPPAPLRDRRPAVDQVATAERLRAMAV